MRICHLTTFWPNRLGTRTTRTISSTACVGIAAERHDVLAEFGSAAAETEAYRCVPCFSRKEDYVEGILAEARKLSPDVVFIQYSNDLSARTTASPDLLASCARPEFARW